jgi:hypothetical protein
MLASGRTVPLPHCLPLSPVDRILLCWVSLLGAYPHARLYFVLDNTIMPTEQEAVWMSVLAGKLPSSYDLPCDQRSREQVGQDACLHQLAVTRTFNYQKGRSDVDFRTIEGG